MRSDKGQSLMEVVVASAVGILVVTALTFATIFSLRNANSAKNSAQATKLAQEGIERVRTGRDRNSSVTIITVPPVDSWSGSNPIWDYQITKNGNCNDPFVGSECYFNVNPSGALNNIGGFASYSFPSTAESISSVGQAFQRVVSLSDTPTEYMVQKKVIVRVRWTDFAGIHESTLTTVLRKL